MRVLDGSARMRALLPKVDPSCQTGEYLETALQLNGYLCNQPSSQFYSPVLGELQTHDGTGIPWKLSILGEAAG